MYAQYLTERTQDKIIEFQDGFATYRYLSPEQVYIIDIFVIPESRQMGIATMLVDKICDEAKTRGCTSVIGTVNPSANGAHVSILMHIAYGAKVHAVQGELIVFKKEL